MKSTGVRFGVRADASSRKPGTAPTLGKVVKMPGYGRRNVRHGRRHRSRQRPELPHKDHALIVKWSIGIGVGTLVLLVVVLAFWLKPQLQGNRVATNGLPGEESSGKAAFKFKSPTQTEALALVKQALALRNPSLVDGLFRPRDAAPLEVVDFLKSLRTKDGEISDCIWLGSLYKNSMQLEAVQVLFDSKDKPKSRMAILTPDLNGNWKLDFDAFARSGKPSWADLLENQADAATVRVFMMKDRYFNGPFADERKWAAYKLASPDIEEMLVGYCKVGSAQHRVLEAMWEHGEITVSRATLEIRHVEGSDRWQFEIDRVLAEDWVMGDTALDEARQ
jgi:hypothetical protein